jgi:hypothetical protein
VVLVAVVVLSALAVPLFGGRLGALAEVRLRRVWAIFAALGLAVVATGLPGLPDGVRSLLLVAAALQRAGLPADAPGFQSSAAVADPRLAFLGDVFALPASWPLSNVFSVGDMLIAVGLAWGVHRICGSRLVPRWTGNAGAPPAGPL